MKKIILFMTLISTLPLYGTTYYVSPTGDDFASGDIDHPWRTWYKASRTALAGDTVYFRGGIYMDNSGNGGVRDFNSGTRDNWIYFFNFPGEIPILDCSNHDTTLNYNRAVRVVDQQYIHFKGLHIQNVFQGMDTNCEGLVLDGCGNIIIENMVIHHVAGECNVVVDYHDTIQYINCDAYNACDSLRTAVYPTPGSPGQNGAGFHHRNWIDPSSVLIYRGCRAWNFSDNGFAGTSVSYLEYDRCWAFAGGELAGSGCGFKYASTYYGNNNYLPLARVIKNCIGAMNGDYGFSPNNTGDVPLNGHYFNNTAYHNGYKGYSWGYGFVINRYGATSPPPNELYANNLSYDNQNGKIYIGADYIHAYNSWDTPPGVTVTDEDFVSLDWTEMLRPRKADGSLPDIDFMRLAEGSDLIDAGTLATNLAYYGTAPDIGYSEYVDNVYNPEKPVYVNSVVEEPAPDVINIFFDKQLANILPDVSAFSVLANNNPVAINSISINNNVVSLYLSRQVTFSDMLRVSYNIPLFNALQSVDGGYASSFFDRQVTNNVESDEEDPVPVKVFPNPNNGRFTVGLLNDLFGENNTVTVYSILGEPVYNDLFRSNEFDLSGLASGIYTLVIKTGEQIFAVEQFVKH